MNWERQILALSAAGAVCLIFAFTWRIRERLCREPMRHQPERATLSLCGTAS